MQGYLAKRYNFWIFLILGLASQFFLSTLQDRSEFLFLFSGYFLAFISLLGMWKTQPVDIKTSGFFIILAGVLLRLPWLFSEPYLSDDYFRFIWDGNLINNGISPYALTPEEIIKTGIISTGKGVENLVQKMNSPQYYSVYPPINQLFFWLSTSVGLENISMNVLIIRILLLSGELVGIFFFFRLWKNIGHETSSILLYWANPLVIIEGIGNMHFEILAVGFLGVGIYYLDKMKLAGSALFWALSAGIKLNPLIFIPLTLPKLGAKKFILFISLTGFVFGLTLIPVFPFLKQFFTSLDLYFHSFEFNASFYYLERELGFAWKGYNLIATIGTLNALLFITGGAILLYGSRAKNQTSQLVFSFLILYSLYLALATTVHPWYIIPLVFLGALSNYFYPILWSFLCILSYQAYSSQEVTENPWVLMIEYLPVYLFAYYEFRRKSGVGVEKPV